MATVTRYINVNSTAGGDGTTNATTGTTRAYASMAEWEAAEQTNLVTDGDVHIVYCDGGAEVVTATINILGWTTSATNYITVQTNTSNEHNGVYDDTGSVYAMVGDNSTMLRMLFVRQAWTRLIGLQFGIKSSRAGWSGAAQTTDFASGEEVYFEKCLFRNLTADAQERLGIMCADADAIAKISNCSFSEFDNHADASGIRFGFNSVSYTFAASYLQHNTFYNCTSGVRGGNTANLQAIRLRNNLFQSCTHSVWDDKGDGWHADSNYNVEGNNEAGEYEVPGANTVHSATITFTDAANGDFHTTDTDTIVANNLYSDSSYATTDDIDGDARPSTGSVSAGYDHVDAPVGGISIPVVQHHRLRNFS